MARKLDRDAVEIVLRAFYPQVYRIALALCGREANAKHVVSIVMQQSLKTIPWWGNETEAGNWFLHHTVLTSRELAGSTPDVSEDCLILALKTPSAEHIAFVKTIRALPAQQAEAFLLLRAEHLDPRQAAVAMDCSTGAAANHLIAATKTLTTMAASSFNDRVVDLEQVYASLTPPADLVIGDVSRATDVLRKKESRRIFRKIVLIIILAIVAWTIWQLSKMIIV